MPHKVGNGDSRGQPDKRARRQKSATVRRDVQGGPYDVDPARAKDTGQGEYGGQPPEGLTRERKGPLNPSTGRR